MANCQTPKTDWQGKDQGDDTYSIPGARDFNRIEGNTQFLKEQTDELKLNMLR